MVESLSTEQLADRWGIPANTLEKYRCSKTRKGPPYVRIEGNIRYKIADIEAYEQTHKNERIHNNKTVEEKDE